MIAQNRPKSAGTMTRVPGLSEVPMKHIIFGLAAIGMVAFTPVDGVAEDSYFSPKVIKELRERTAAGDLAAMYKLGYTLQGDPDESNDAEGRDFMIEAANRGYW